jgi:N utilization substance protein B
VASRRRAREYALQALFFADLGRSDARTALGGLWEGLMDEDDSLGKRAPDSEEIEFATTLACGVESNRDDLDAAIEGASTNWRVARMAVVDRNLLRLGAFELLHCPDIPANVTINEAVELAKRFGAGDSKGFVNGILDRIARDMGRLRPRRR